MISLIAALAEDNAIGMQNSLLWHLSEDLKYFKATTLQHPVIMGRKTFESIGRALPGRRNIVVSSRKLDLPEPPKYKKDGSPSHTSIEQITNFKEFLDSLKNAEEEFFVIGGGSIYKAAFRYADRLYITKIHAKKEGADTFFPFIDEKEWRILSESELLHDPENNLNFQFIVYEHV